MLISIVRRHWPVVTLFGLGLLAILLPSIAAFAQTVPTPAPNNPNPPTLVEWSIIATVVLSGLLKALSPGNTALPPEFSPKVLQIINVGGGVVTTCLLGIVGGTPWLQAIGAGILPIVIGYVQVGAATSSWLAILENALLPMTRRAQASTALGKPVPTAPAATPEVKS
jgi:hypothetical protein